MSVMKPAGARAAIALAFATLGVAVGAVSAEEPLWDGNAGGLEVTSTTFTDNGPLPDSVIYNALSNGLNICTASGAAGGDESPQLQWQHVPRETRSFVVILYDPTASFTHWGMYNIPAQTRALPQNAGVAGSSFGTQVTNDFGDKSYDGPCPPQGVAPEAHHYVITVYALDTDLKLPALANFPSNAETLYHALIRAGRHGHILASGHIGTYYSATPN
jgi:Raf kinase inhibitor-like YbhB/YbcL family protein